MPGDPLVAIALRAAEAAGEAVMRIYAGGFDVRQKDDKTPVTEADLAAERVVVAMPPAARVWLVCPRDGTREFVDCDDEVAVLIGLVEAGRPVLGVVHGPALGLTYTAHGPGTARRRRRGGEFEPIAARMPSPGGVVVVHSRSHENSRRLAEYFEGRPIKERRICGSALKFGMLAAGEADFYPRFGTTMEWDTAAGQAVLEAAGGSVAALDGTPLAYGQPGLKNEGFLAWGRERAW